MKNHIGDKPTPVELLLLISGTFRKIVSIPPLVEEIANSLSEGVNSFRGTLSVRRTKRFGFIESRSPRFHRRLRVPLRTDQPNSSRKRIDLHGGKVVGNLGPLLLALVHKGDIPLLGRS